MRWRSVVLLAPVVNLWKVGVVRALRRVTSGEDTAASLLDIPWAWVFMYPVEFLCTSTQEQGASVHNWTLHSNTSHCTFTLPPYAFCTPCH